MSKVRKRARGHPLDELRELAAWFDEMARSDPSHRPTVAVARILQMVTLEFRLACTRFPEGRTNPGIAHLDKLAAKVVGHLKWTPEARLAGGLLATKKPAEAVHDAHHMIRTSLAPAKKFAECRDTILPVLVGMIRRHFASLPNANAKDLPDRLAAELRAIAKSKDNLCLEPKDTPRIIERAFFVAGLTAPQAAHKRTKPIRKLWHRGQFRVPGISPKK